MNWNVLERRKIKETFFALFTPFVGTYADLEHQVSGIKHTSVRQRRENKGA